MEQLTIKELSTYLPYDITIMFNKKYKGTLVGLLGNKWNLAEIKFEFGNDRKDIEVCYPVLRPLSDLTDEQFKELLNLDIGHIDYISIEREYWIERKGYENWLKQIPYGVIEKLLSWHYDIFNLIPRNLAIDINTIK